VLDRVWERDRLETTGELTITPGSGVRRRSQLHPTEAECARELEDRDTVPAPPPTVSEPPPVSEPPVVSEAPDEPMDEVSHDVVIPPERRRITVPYTAIAWASGRNTPRVLVVAADDDLRTRLARALRGRRYALATAAHRDGARALYARLEPDLVVVDLETLAPDYEPIRPALEALFGEMPPSKVVVVSDAPVRERVSAVQAVIPACASQDELVAAFGELLASS
jgi:hypothetical protein